MSFMATLYPAVLLSLGVGILEFILPGERDGKTARTVRTVAGLCVLLSLLAPITEGISLLRTLAVEGTDGLRERLEASTLTPTVEPSEEPQALADRLAEAGAAEVEAWVLTALQDSFGIPPDCAAVTAQVAVTLGSDGSEDGVTLERVYISLSGRFALSNPHDIEAWFSERLGCTVALSVS